MRTAVNRVPSWFESRPRSRLFPAKFTVNDLSYKRGSAGLAHRLSSTLSAGTNLQPPTPTV
jgi:hypothetical protein